MAIKPTSRLKLKGISKGTTLQTSKTGHTHSHPKPQESLCYIYMVKGETFCIYGTQSNLSGKIGPLFLASMAKVYHFLDKKSAARSQQH